MVDNVLKIQQHLIVLNVNVQLVTRAKFVTHPSLSHVCKICFSHQLVISYVLRFFQLVYAIQYAKMADYAMLMFVYVLQVIPEQFVK